MIYVCLLPLYQFIVFFEKLQYFRLSHHVSIIKIAGITALRMSLNLIKYSSHVKENIYIYIYIMFVYVCSFFMLVLLYLTNDSSSFCYS